MASSWWYRRSGLCLHLLSFLLTFPIITSQLVNPSRTINVRYGYFPEARPVHAACGLGWMDFYDAVTDTLYQVGCYPQTSGGFAASRLDNGHLDIAHLGSTPLAQALARGVDIQVIYISHYMGDSQGIYVRASQGDYVGIQKPEDLVGRTIGVPFGSTMHYQALFLLDAFGLTLEDVTLLNLSPTGIIEAWDEGLIDGGACWGAARDHLLKQGGKGNVDLLPAHTFMSAGAIANWGSTTFVDIAARRRFAQEHPLFLSHVVAVLSRINDSFVDRLGIDDSENPRRWDSTNDSSYVPSMADALMDRGQVFQAPTSDYKNLQRRALDLFIQQTALEQLTCDYFGRGSCSQPTLQHQAIRQTAVFLLNQKIISRLGRLDEMGEDTECQADSTFCGGDLLDGSFLEDGQRVCSSCYPAGPYAGVQAGSDTLLSVLEQRDSASGRSPFAPTEIGRGGGNSVCSGHTVADPASGTGILFDGANVVDGTVYSANSECTWEIRAVDCESSSSTCETIVQVSLDQVRLWSGDYVRIYTDPSFLCSPDSTDLRLIAQATGFDINFPPISAQGCVMVEFVTDSNIERSYGDIFNTGYGFVASYNRDSPACSDTSDCNGRTCNFETGLCDCGGDRWGSDCSFSEFCFGVTRISLPDDSASVEIGSNAIIEPDMILDGENDGDIVDPSSAYPNDLYCTFEIQAPRDHPFVEFDITYDLEPTHDLLWLQTGVDQAYAVLTGVANSQEGIVVPTDENRIASLRLTTDALGRRSGFHATVRATRQSQTPPGGCGDGFAGLGCEFPYCIAQNVVSQNTKVAGISSSYVAGRIVSQSPALDVRPMPWAKGDGCRWSIPLDDAPQKTTALRLVFNKDFDLEPFPAAAVGDKLIIQNDAGSDKVEFFVEECSTDDDCSHDWQTGTCLPNGGGCEVRKAVEVPISTTSPSYSAIIVTDRNDGPGSYSGLDFDMLFVKSCPAADSHCEAQGGRCDEETGYCICESGKPCGCTCDGSFASGMIKTGLVIGIVVPVFIIFFVIFLWYRRRKNKKSRAYKDEIKRKEEELQAFRNSVVGMRTAQREYVPLVQGMDEASLPLSMLVPLSFSAPIWCWQETETQMSRHADEKIYGDPSECFIRYDDTSNSGLEAAYNEQGGRGDFMPLPGYVVNFDTMTQTKISTGFQRTVRRVIETSQTAGINNVDLQNAERGNALPKDIIDEPQMVLVTGDIIQISTQRKDGWAFGTKLFHMDEVLARQLVQVATDRWRDDDCNVFTDTGWFKLDATDVPTGEELALLQNNVGDTGALDAPSTWDPVRDPSIAQLHPVTPDRNEYKSLVHAFMSTLVPPKFNKRVTIVGVERIQNLAMWQSYVVKRQTICYRETGSHANSGTTDDMVQLRALERFERRWLWHGTNSDVMDKILQQGFNRSFCGRNATMYGKGVYFARDASYSAQTLYAVPDRSGIQYVMACRVVVGEYCRGVSEALTPDVRDPTTQSLYDSTVGLLGNDTMANPSIYVTYHDAQAYPEYLIKFRASR